VQPHASNNTSFLLSAVYDSFPFLVVSIFFHLIYDRQLSFRPDECLSKLFFLAASAFIRSESRKMKLSE
jgi:hypothetical protein